MRSLRAARSRRTALVTLLGVSLIAGVASYVPEAEAKPLNRPAPAVSTEKSTPGKNLVPKQNSDEPSQPAAANQPPATVEWPAAGTLTSSSASLGALKTPQSAVSVGSSTAHRGAVSPAVRVEVLDQTASSRMGISGVVLRAVRIDTQKTPGTVKVKVDYSKFAGAIGGDWSSRLRLVELECTSATACVQKRVLPAGRNDVRSQTLSADLVLPPVLPAQQTASKVEASFTTFAVTAAAGGPAGSYAATPLAPSSMWNVGAQTGDFSWSYPFRVPPGTAGPRPQLAINYSSGSIDGQVASSNNQTSWVGQGHSLEQGYVERKYVSCADDMVNSNTTVKTGDLCWRSDNAVLSLGGHSGELIKVSSDVANKVDTFKLKNDDGSLVQRFQGAANGARDGEYWLLTTTDGTRYYFGLNPAVAGTARANSVNTVPVFGNQTGEPCHQATFAASYCTQAWRWSVDRVVDVNDNLMTYRYVQENNYYGRNNNTGVSLYQRASYPYIVDYGKTAGANEAATTAPARAWFGVAERCIPGGAITCDPAQLTAANAANWPDVPFDQICTSSSTCPNRTSPSFFTRKRLASINTEVLKASAYAPVDTWNLAQDYPVSGDKNRSLFLLSITHQGRAGGTLTNPSVTFSRIDMPNRVDAIGDGAPAMTKYRVSEINSESGQSTNVNYSAPQCTSSPRAETAPTNVLRCFPVYWTIDGGAAPTLHWFNKYVVTEVAVHDDVVPGVDQVTAYDYVGTPAWHFDDNELTALDYRSWGDWRGYSKVNVRAGSIGNQSQTQYTYFRGMDGDYLDKKGTARKTATLTDSLGDAIVDAARLNGFVREEITYNGAGGPEVSGTINTPWMKQTASVGGDVATLLQTKLSLTRTRLSSGSYRTVGVSTTFDDLGMPVSIGDLGDVSVSSDDRCMRYTYNRNADSHLMNPISREEKVSVGCGVTPNRPEQVIDDQRSYFDGSSDLNAKPVNGLITKVETMSGWSGGPVYQARSRTVYDSLGRITETYDGLNRRTSKVTFTPATGGPVTGTSTEDAKGYVSSTIIDPAWGSTLSQIDPNGRRTDLTYDAFGRLTAVWLPNRAKSSTTASMVFSYLLSKTAPSVVATQELLPSGTYKTSTTLFDGLLRQRQVQTPSASGVGRVLLDTTYDKRGNVATQDGPYADDSSAPSNTLFEPDVTNLASRTITTYDGADRPIQASFVADNAEKWKTQTIYGGNAVTVIPPAGGTTTTQMIDARGKVSELRQFHGAAATGDYDSTRYTYTPDDQLETVTNADGTVWRYTYDLRGRQIKAEDPDKGTSTSTYDDADRLVSTTNAKNQSLYYSYDVLDRKTAVRKDSPTGDVLASWVYDTLGKGLLTSSTRTVGGSDYVSSITGYDAMDQPTGTRVVIPASEGKLAGTYNTTTTYNPDGTVKKAKLPTTPGLPDETVEMTYDSVGNPLRMGGWQAYVSGTKYSPYGEPLQYAMGQKSEKLIYQSFDYERGTRRLAEMKVDRNGVTATDDVFKYTYDNASNVKSVSHQMGAVTDRQCFSTDHLRRMTQAWTPTGECSEAPSASTLGGPAPYWQSYSYSLSGNRTQMVDHKAAGDTTSTYAYPAATAPRPHAVTGVTTAGPAGTSADTYAYDELGNLSARTVGGDTDNFAWDLEGHLTSVSGPAGETSYIYDAEGSRLIRHDPKGATLYLASAEVRWDKAADSVSSTRYYDFNGSTVAMRSDPVKVEFLIADPQGTANVSIDGLSAEVSRRYMGPFGDSRGAASPTWDPSARGFVNGVDDASTGLTHLGAREYDAKLGRFISVDPLVDTADPQTLNAYAYSNSNPATFSDPDGLMFVGSKGEGGGTESRGRSKVEEYNKQKAKTGDVWIPYKNSRGDNVNNSAEAQVEERITRHAENVRVAKERVKKVIKDLVKIVADELGITDALNCFKDGDVGACISTGVTVLSSFVGGIAGKLISKYLFHAKKAWKLIGNLKDLVNRALDAIGELRSARCAVGNSFVPGTLVLLADGTRKAIEKLTLDDKVLAADPESGEVSAEPVVRTIIGHGMKELVDIAVTATNSRGVATSSIVTATTGHRFYVPAVASWIDAAELTHGVRLATSSLNQNAYVSNLRSYSRVATVFNLTIANVHTFYVIAGDAPILVHNCGGPVKLSQDRIDTHVTPCTATGALRAVVSFTKTLMRLILKDSQMMPSKDHRSPPSMIA